MARVMVCMGLVLAAGSALADGGRYNARIEPAAAFFVDDPQSSDFGVGGDLHLRGEYAPIPMVGLELGFGATHFTPDGQPEGGRAYAVTVGGRVRPLDDSNWEARAERGRVSGVESGLWFGADGGLTATGGDSRPALSAGLGLDAPVAKELSIGPFVRYEHVFQPSSAGSPADAQFVLAGLSAVLGLQQPRVELRVAEAEPEPVPVPPAPVDTDGDGILDPNDGCPREPEDRDQYQDEDGCPELDNDGDGIADASDACPMQPETMNGHEDTDGCPDTAPPVVTAEAIVIQDHVNFALDSAELLGTSHEILNRVAELLVAHPEITRVRIEGHTDDSGTDEHNMRLSRHRAESVRVYLQRQGVARRRMVSRGYGKTQPIDNSGSEDARARNRRVAFHIEERRE